MKEKEAISELEHQIEIWNKPLSERRDSPGVRAVNKSRIDKVESLYMGVSALEKQIPKQATFVKEVMGLLAFRCNSCGREFFTKTNMTKYCSHCGQRLREE